METKFKLTSEGIEISGSEEFVTTQIENFKSLFHTTYEKLLDRKVTTPHEDTNKEAGGIKKVLIQNPHSQVADSDEVEYVEVNKTGIDYDNVLVIDKDKIQIIVDVKDPTKSQRMIKIILLYMWAKLQQGVETIAFPELRDVCQYYDALDYTNFAKHIDANKRFFITLGDGKNKSAKLIRPGIKEAEKLIQELSQNNN